MIEIMKSLKKVMEDKHLSPEQASGYIGCSGRQIRRWLEEVCIPNPVYREAIRQGIEKIKRDAL